MERGYPVGMLTLPNEVELREAFKIGDLEELRASWAELWRADPVSTPFQSPGWLIPWWRYLGQGKLHCLSLWRGEDLCGLAPFYIYPRPADGKRQLLILGSGNSDYLDILTRPGQEFGVLKQVGRWLTASQEQWDIAEFLQLRPSSWLLRSELTEGASQLSEEWTVQESCPVLRLPTTPEGDWSFFDKPCFTRLHYYWRRASRAGSLRIDCADLESLDEGLEALIRFEDARWHQKGLKSALHEVEIQQFHHDACYNLFSAGLLRFYMLRLENRIIAVLYGFHDRGRFYYYLGGFDAAFSNLSPGKLVLAHAMQGAVHERAAVFDFLRGQEAYKYEWGARDTPTFRRALWTKKNDAGYEHSSSNHQTRCL
jgi:CelD/BcsL family acetyltransferase involved in cellulose biosynthesis